MRPTDEHQTPSTRPNFTSAKSRPATAGDNILARLERSGANPASTPWSRTVKLGLAGGVALALGLAWCLAGLYQDAVPDHREAQVMVATPTPLEPAPLEQAPELASDMQAPAALAQPSTPARADATVDPQSLEPVPVLPMLADVVEKAPAAPAAPAVRTAPRPSQRHGASGHTRASRPAPNDKGIDGSVDGDVALLSAILIHAPRHSAERARAEAKCKEDKKCVTGPLPALLKATE